MTGLGVVLAGNMHLMEGTSSNSMLDELGIFLQLDGGNSDTSSSREISQLVEDKDIAAKAVAFVVNSTRKGIVPLCADVATLLKSKKKLESKVARLRSENSLLRHSAGSLDYRTDHSASPLPHSLTSYSDRASIPEPHPGTPHLQEKSRPCSRCSSVGEHHLSAFTVPSTRGQQMYSSTSSVPAVESAPLNQVDSVTRKNSLPEMVTEPGIAVPRISPNSQKLNMEVQCNLQPTCNRSLEEQFRQTLEANQALAEELGAARKEIQILRGRLKELEMQNYKCSPQYHLEDECSRHEEPCSFCPSVQLSRTPGLQRSPVGLGCPMMLPSPLPGCRCTCCETYQEANPGKSTRGRRKEEISYSKLPVEIGDHVVIKGDQTGHIRYLGHLDGIGHHGTVYAGIELDAMVGCKDGCLNDKRYFSCKRDHAVFVPLQDILCVVNKMTHKPAAAPIKAFDLSSSSSSSECCPDAVRRDKYDKMRSHKKYKKYCLKLHRDSTNEPHGDLV